MNKTGSATKVKQRQEAHLKSKWRVLMIYSVEAVHRK